MSKSKRGENEDKDLGKVGGSQGGEGWEKALQMSSNFFNSTYHNVGEPLLEPIRLRE